MKHETILKIFAWLFSIVSIILIIFAFRIPSGVTFCAVALVLALLFQNAYVREIKKNGK